MPEAVQETTTPEVELLRAELERTKEIFNLNGIERKQLREKMDRLQMAFNSAPRTPIERKIIGIIQRHLTNPIIMHRRENCDVGGRAFEISFPEVENHIILYAETSSAIYDLGYYVESVGTDFIYIAKR